MLPGDSSHLFLTELVRIKDQLDRITVFERMHPDNPGVVVDRVGGCRRTGSWGSWFISGGGVG
jgi:hypothetical protein